MERYGRGRGKRKLLGSHQRSWVWGRNAVLEILKAGRWPVAELHLGQDLPEAELALARHLAERQKAPVLRAPSARLTALCHSHEHQDYLAKMGEFPYADIEPLVLAAGTLPLYAVLDRLQDPFNFAGIIRSAEVFGADAIVIGEHGQAKVTSAVARGSAGAVARLPIVLAPDLVQAAQRLRAAGITLVAASEKAERSVTAHDFRRPTAVVIGNEGDGVGQALMAVCEAAVRIPQSGTVGSLNAAAAAAVVFYEARRQRALKQPR